VIARATQVFELQAGRLKHPGERRPEGGG